MDTDNTGFFARADEPGELLSAAEASPVLVALTDPRERVRTAAFRAAARLPLSPAASATVSALARKLLDGHAEPDESVARHDLITSTALLRQDDIQSRVHAILAQGPTPDRQAATEGLVAAGDPVVVPELLEQLNWGGPQARAEAAQALSSPALAGVTGVAEALRAATHDRSTAVALPAAVGVARTGDVSWLVNVLRWISAGELDLSGLIGRPVAFTLLSGKLRADLVEFTRGHADDMAGVIARTLTTPPVPEITSGPARMARLFPRYAEVEQAAPGEAAQLAWAAGRTGMRRAIADLAPYLSTPAVMPAALHMATDIARFRDTSAPLVISGSTITLPEAAEGRIIQVAVPDDFELTRGYVPAAASPPPPAASAGLVVAEPVRRQLQGRLPEQVQLGEPVQLLVRVAVESGSGLRGLREVQLDPFDIGPQGLTLSLTVEAPGLKALSRPQGTVLVPPSGDSGWALFEFDTTAPGVSTVTVMAFNGGARVGVLPMEITVDPEVVTTPPVTRIAPVKPRNREVGDLSLIIRYDQAGGTYRYQLIDWTIDAPEEARTAPLKEPPKKTVESLVAQLNLVARKQVGWDAAQTLDWLQGKGLELWSELIPQDLQNALLDRLDDIQCLMIYTDGDVVPWELLCPSAAEGFLVERCRVSRWLKGLDGPVPGLHLRPAALALPQTAPSAAETEINTVRDVLARCGSSVLPVARDLDALREILGRHDFSVLHFASHNTFAPDAPDTSSIMFGTQPFVPSFLTKYRGDKYRQVPPAFQQHAPVIFMNACRTDGKAGLFTELYGWAEKFLYAGAGAFIGTSWEVVDSSALLFAETFYDKLGGGATIGDAMTDARRRIRDVTGDPTWLAYTLYGDPKATAVTA